MLKTSLFNKGIYKSQLSRFKWGSLLYFILLFFTSSFLFLIDDYTNISEYTLERYAMAGGMILVDDYFGFSVLLASVVPTVVAFLTFDMFSSKRQSVFIHSLPCGRTAIYISTVLGAFTLMAVPVIANGIILMLLSVFKCSSLFSVYACVKWIALNFILLFIMFSVSVFSAGLTANRVALVFINALLHVAPFIVTFGIGGIASVYLYGFDENFNYFLNKITEWMPMTAHWTFFRNYSRFVNNIFSVKYLIFAAGAVVLYVLGFILYKKRNNESAGNFVAFKIMNPIFKYVITAFGVVITFSVLHISDFERGFYMVFLLVVISAVLYFASEMVLKKNLKVFSAYKGYLVFAAACIVLNVFLQYTGFFGYEKRIPTADSVETVAMYAGYDREKPYTDDAAVIAEAIKFHEDIVSDIPDLIERYREDYGRITIEYKLKNGKTLTRTYYDIHLEKRKEILRDLYSHESYRFAMDSVLKLDISEIDYLRLAFNASDNSTYTFGIEGKSNIEAFMTEWKKDIAVLGYDEIEEWNSLYLDVDYERDKNDYDYNTESAYVYVHKGFNHNYKNVMAYLEKNGYLDKLYKLGGYDVYISKEAHTVETKRDEDGMTRRYFDGESDNNYFLEANEVEPIAAEDVEPLVKDVLKGVLQRNYEDNGEKYIIYAMDENLETFERYTVFLTIDKDKLPEYLRKYIQ